MGWLPRTAPATLRNATVAALANGNATLAIDGGSALNVPIYGASPAVGDKVLVAVQGDSMVVLGKAGGGDYLPLSGGTVQTRHTTIYGHSLLLDINEDEGLMLGTMGPDPDAEFSGIIWTPPMVPGRNGSRVNLASEFPIMLQTPAATMDAELVNKGYVDAQVGTKVGQIWTNIQWNLEWFRDFGQGWHAVTVIKTGRMVSIQGMAYMHRAEACPGGAVVASVPDGYGPAEKCILRCVSGEATGSIRFNLQTNRQLTLETAVAPGTYVEFQHTYLAAS
jgi:hypothetical protein